MLTPNLHMRYNKINESACDLLAVRQYFLIGKYSISGNISHNALCYYFCSLVVVLRVKLFFLLYFCYDKKNLCLL